MSNGTRIYVNNYSAGIVTAIGTSTTTIVVSTATGLPTLSGNQYYYLTISNGVSSEIVKVTSRSTTTLTVVRAQEGTTGVAWPTGTPITMRYTAASIVDSNGNAFANNYSADYTTTATAASNTTLTVSSSQLQFFTGTTTQNILLPVTSTLPQLGFRYHIVNNSTGSITVKSSGSNTILTLLGSTSATFTCILLSGTTAASWSYEYFPALSGAGGTALTKTDDTNVTLTLGGSSSTALVNPASLTLGWTGQLAIARGGTGVSSIPTSSTASAFAAWDSNKNISANNFQSAFAIQATAASTTTLTVADKQQQVFTGATTQTVVLPAVSTLAQGTCYYITNLSTGQITIQTSSGIPIITMDSKTTLAIVSNTVSGTTTSVWTIRYYTVAMAGDATSSITGSGNLVRNTSPTLVTPILGAANANSVNFGGSSLSTYEESGTWTPTFTFSTPGDLSVGYSSQVGYYTRVGNVITLVCKLNWTPTYTTSSGNALVGGLPYTPKSSNSIEWVSGNVDKSAFTLPTGTTSLAMMHASSGTTLYFVGTGTGVASATSTTANFPTATLQFVYFSLTYLV